MACKRPLAPITESEYFAFFRPEDFPHLMSLVVFTDGTQYTGKPKMTEDGDVAVSLKGSTGPTTIIRYDKKDRMFRSTKDMRDFIVMWDDRKFEVIEPYMVAEGNYAVVNGFTHRIVKTNGKNLVGMTIDDGHHERTIDGDMVSYYLRKIDDDEPLDFE